MTRFAAGAALAGLVAGAAGCLLLDKAKLKHRPPEPTFSQYHLEGWNWDRVDRVLVLPFLNESQFTRAGDEVRIQFASELQRMGRFEVVGAPADDRAVLAAQIHRGGRFDEAAMLELANATKADVVVHGIITQYSPYPRPRMGLIIQAVGPNQAKVVASVDGLWDTTDAEVAERCREFYRQRPHKRLPVVRNNLVVESDDGLATDLALEEPRLFQRWVSYEVVQALVCGAVPKKSVLHGVKSRAVVTDGATAANQTVCPPAAPAAPGENVK